MAAGDNTQDMIYTILHRLGDPGATKWNDVTEIVSYINATQREMLDLLSHRALHEVTSIDSTTLVAAQSTYDLPSDFAYALRVIYKSDDAVLWPLEQLRALRQNTHHSQSETSPYVVIWDDKLEFFVGSGGVTQTNGDTCELWYIAEPTAVSTTADMDFGNQFRNIIEQGAVARALEQGDAGNYQQAQIERGIFEFLCEMVNMHYGRVASYGGFANDPAPLNPQGG